jgi:hypothetical protein
MKPESLAKLKKNSKPYVIDLQMDRSQWMHGIRRVTIEYLRGVEKFIYYATEDMSQRGDQLILYPCRDYQN